MPLSNELRDALRAEVAQLREEGCDAEVLVNELACIEVSLERQAVSLYEAAYRQVAELTPSPDFPYEEPSDLPAIRAARAAGPRRLGAPGRDLDDRLLGAWLGRCAGCMLGKPVEGRTKAQIDALLAAAGEPALTDYFPAIPDAPPELHWHAPDNPMLRGNITHGVRDDDTDYTVIGLHYLEENGLDFTSQDVAHQWQQHLPYTCVYTAERVAYRNLVNGINPPESATFRNPFREWIGAQIRCDAFGYAAPGWPEKAAEFAFRDAAVSHVKNGIYGEMLFAAMIAAALVTRDLEAALDAALAEIPAQSRLHEAMVETRRFCAEESDWQAAWERINAAYGHYHGVHTINNAALVLMGLLYGARESDPALRYERAIALAVHGGWDTDCNGATAGSVMGALLGAEQLPAKWTSVLKDRLESIVVGLTDNRISDLARRTATVAGKVTGEG
ncbi:MAG: ADP-ribosylglycohydrolase family protein [Armatimonadetes bacterium]|nr:ADP-ribosylglycohydrolase family protein [Armatimonadota bacterium]